MGLALLFPGQGSQFVGMGQELAEAFPQAARVFEEADDVLDLSLSAMMWEASGARLKETRNSQPALLVHSVAAWRVVESSLGEVRFAAGHSVGEYAAHVAAGTLSFADALRAVRRRGELMSEAGDVRPGTMAAVLGLSDEEVVRALDGLETGICVPANFNSAGQVVVSGDVDGVEAAMEALKEAGAKRVVPLNVSGAFHSPLMEPAEEGLAAFLESIEFRDPAVPVVANVDARPVTDGARARELLVEQLTGQVRWSESIATMVEGGATGFLELGAGSVLCGLNRRNARGMPCSSVGTPGEVESFLESLEGGEA